MKYCSLQHFTLLSLPVTSTTGHSFGFGSISLLFLEFFLQSSPGASTDLGSSSFSVISFCLFILFMGSSRQECCFVRTLLTGVLSGHSTMTHPSQMALNSMVHSFIKLHKAVIHVIILVSFLWLWFSFCLPSDGEG